MPVIRSLMQHLNQQYPNDPKKAQQVYYSMEMGRGHGSAMGLQKALKAGAFNHLRSKQKS